jgi:hypothetical protein
MNVCQLNPRPPQPHSSQPHSPVRRRASARRRGAVLICVLACCLTALSLSLTAVRQALRSTRESKQLLKLRQTEWLLNAGVLRVRQKLQDVAYTGETWEIPSSVTRSEAAVIWISVDPSSSAAPSGTYIRTVTITAETGTTPHAMRRSCQLTLAQPPSLENGSALSQD